MVLGNAPYHYFWLFFLSVLSLYFSIYLIYLTYVLFFVSIFCIYVVIYGSGCTQWNMSFIKEKFDYVFETLCPLLSSACGFLQAFSITAKALIFSTEPNPHIQWFCPNCYILKWHTLFNLRVVVRNDYSIECASSSMNNNTCNPQEGLSVS